MVTKRIICREWCKKKNRMSKAVQSDDKKVIEY